MGHSLRTGSALAASVLALISAGCSSTVGSPPKPQISSAIGAIADCGSNTPPRVVSGDFGPVIGSGALMVSGFTGPPLQLHLGNDPAPAGGWQRKVLFVSPPASRVVVRVRVLRLPSRTPIVIEPNGGSSGTVVTYDPAHPGARGGTENWGQYPTFLRIPSAGCFEMDSQWSGGSWEAIFGAGP